jgi:hypothetical protein
MFKTASQLIVLFLFCQCASAQLVNIESRRMQTDSIRFVLKNEISFSYNNNDGVYIYEVSNELSTQAKSKDLRKIYFLIGNYNILKSENEDFRNTWLLHFRFNYQITNLFRLESFVQSQRNKLLFISSRNLIGAGIRLKVISKEHMKLYLSNAYIYEEEKSDEIDKKFYNNRNSSYLSLSVLLPNSDVNIINTIYFQPLYKDFNDFRILEELKIEIPFSKKFNLSSSFNYYYYSSNAIKRKEYISNVKIGLGINL